MPKLDKITVDPKVFQGQPCIRHMRIPVSSIVELVPRNITSLTNLLTNLTGHERPVRLNTGH